ncbi:MAG: alpha/beta hydrolase [Pseudoxanthomonas sp.]
MKASLMDASTMKTGKPMLLFALLMLLPPVHADAQQRLRERMQQMREASRQERPVAVPAGGKAISNVAYGDDPAQRFDVYLPARADRVPVVFYVHGGGWANGDKTNPGIENKLLGWLPEGYAVISANYRMLPAARPLDQAKDVARALAAAQRHAGEWGIDASRFVLMGHSAGAHLVALLGAKPSLLVEAGAQRPRGVVSLDSGALDVAALMSQRRVPRLYQDAFGSDPAYWAATSPLAQLGRDALPMQLVCSSTRNVPTSPCDEARAFAQKASTLGVPMQVLPQALNHGQINHDLGAPSAYTDAVATYIDALVR